MGNPAAEGRSYFETANAPGDLRGDTSGFLAHLLVRPQQNPQTASVEQFLAGCFDDTPGFERGFLFRIAAGNIEVILGTGAGIAQETCESAQALDGTDMLVSAYYSPLIVNDEFSLYVNGQLRGSESMAAVYVPAPDPFQFSIGGYDVQQMPNLNIPGALRNKISAFSIGPLLNGFTDVTTLAQAEDRMLQIFNSVQLAQDIPQVMDSDSTGSGDPSNTRSPLHLYSAAQSLRNLEDGQAATWDDRGTSAPAPLERTGTFTRTAVVSNWQNWCTSLQGN